MTAPFTEAELLSVKQSVLTTDNDVKPEVMEAIKLIREFLTLKRIAVMSLVTDCLTSNPLESIQQKLSEQASAIYIGYLIGRKQAETEKLEEMASRDGWKRDADGAV